MTHLELRKQLRSKLTNPESSTNRLIGKCNDATLALLVKEIRKNPRSLDPFVAFVQCLNFSYSTRLQLGKNGRNETVKKAAKILRDNWFKRAKLSEIRQDQAVDYKKVESLRDEISEGLGINFYSFVTKVFHQLNSKYPIIDGNVKSFMSQHKFSGRMNFSSPSRTYGCFHERFIAMMQDLKWKNNNVESLDAAIWQFITDQKARKKAKQ